MKQTAFQPASLVDCSISGRPVARIFFEITQIPVLCNVHWPRREAALRAARGDIRLAYSPVVGHLFNTTFDEALIYYDQSYDNTLMFSPRFRRYLEALSTDLINRYQLYDKDITEVGCGQGDFLKLMVDVGNNRGVGFDKSCVPHGEDHPNITFVEDFYTARYAAMYPADFIACRQVLEHIPDPATFLRQIRAWIGNRLDTVIFFEVPNALYILRNMGVWDFIYEHVSYFTPPALAYLFGHCGFDVQRIADTYEGQFLTIEATPSANTIGTMPEMGIALAEIDELVEAFVESYERKVENWRQRLDQFTQAGQKVVIWGGGSKGVTFLNLLRTKDSIAYVVDINPRQQGLYVAGTGQQFVPPDFLKQYQPDVILIMNPIYEREIRETGASLGIQPEYLLV